VLAAGRSRRMGAPKALLTFQGETFLARIVRVLREGGCERVIVVVGPTDERDVSRIVAEARALGVELAVNPEPYSEQIDSLRVAIRTLPAEAGGILMTPVDAPGATAEVVAGLVKALREGAPIAVPAYGGERGHPVGFGGRLLPELLTDDFPEGARSLIRAHEAELVEVEAPGPAILLDIDTPADYDRLREGQG
jgi:molybdenum cofactor cytidylyltransferase